jgi:hypothetical protein
MRNNYTKKPDIHKARMKKIRKFVDFDYDLRKPLSDYEKRKIKTYYDAIDALTARPHYEYRPRRSDHLKKAKAYGQGANTLPGLKVAFIPTGEDEKPRIYWDNSGEMVVESEHITRRYADVSTAEFLADPEGAARRVVEEHPEGKGFSMLAGEFEIPETYAPSQFPEQVGRKAAKYGDPDDNHYIGNWFGGFAVYNFQNQKSYKEYAAKKQQAKKDRQRLRSNEKKREKRKKLTRAEIIANTNAKLKRSFDGKR